MSPGHVGPPRRKPPWWPDNEEWPPQRVPWAMGDSAEWRRWRRVRLRMGCLTLLVVLLLSLFLIWSGHAGGDPILHVVMAVILAVLSLVALASVTVIAVLVVRRVAGIAQAPGDTKVDDLVAAAARVQEGDYTARVPETGSAEQRLLARSFNQMSEQLGATDVRRRSFMADVSHELRTPLTVIQGQLEAIRDGIYPADAAHLAPALDQVRTLEWLVEDLRTLALSDSGTLRLVRQDVDLGTLVAEVVEGFRTSAESAGIQLAVSVADQLPIVSVDPGRIASVIRNLVANALRHTPSGGAIAISVAAAGSDVLVTVRDTGRGIDPALLPTIFERFSRSADSTGSGLGLAIAKALVEAHGGSIEASSEPGQGSTITFRLPVER